MSDLLDLAARVEAAEAGEQRAIIWEAGLAIRMAGDRLAELLAVAAYESAAMQLVPEGWCFTVATWWCEGEEGPPFFADCGDLEAMKADKPDAILVDARAATPALALCAASLRARSAQP